MHGRTPELRGALCCALGCAVIATLPWLGMRIGGLGRLAAPLVACALAAAALARPALSLASGADRPGAEGAARRMWVALAFGALIALSCAALPTSPRLPALPLIALPAGYLYARALALRVRAEAALNPPAPRLSAGWVFALVAALSALGLGLHWSLRFPASNAIDTAYQWDQVHGLLPYTDLHTPGHTMLLKALYALWDSPASAVGAHIAALATLQGCFAVYLYRRGAHLGWLLALSALFTACSDPTKWYFYPGKDIPYTACLAGITYLLMRSREPGFRFGWWRAAGLGALLAFSVLFRYNGIVPVALCGLYFAVYFMRRRQAGRLVALALAAGICALSVNAYAYRALNMARVKNGFAVQTFGAGIAAVVAQEGEMTPQQLARIGNALPISWMREHYKPWATKQLVWKREPSVESHPIDQGCNNCFVLAMGDRPAEVVGIYLSLLPRNAGLLLKELARNTTVVWSARNAGGAFSIPLLTLTLAIIACAAWSRRTARRHIVVFLPVAANLLSIAASTVTNEYRYLLPTFTLFWPLAIYIVLIGRNETAAGAPNVIG